MLEGKSKGAKELFLFKAGNKFIKKLVSGFRNTVAVFRIQIRTGSGPGQDPDSWVSGSGSRKEKMTHKDRKIRSFQVFKCWMFYLWRLWLESPS
jgi:hypothetical protein